MVLNQIKQLKLCAFVIFSILFFYSLSSVKLHNATSVINSDVTAYYTYLPAVFIYQDVELKFINNLPNVWYQNIWRYKTKTDKSALKMTSGLAILYLPFFLLGHLLATVLEYPPNGYSIPYAIMLLVAGIFYTSAAFYYTGRLLAKYFKFSVALITSLLLIFATNLLIYSSSLGAYSHAFNFFLFTFFLWKTIEYYDLPNIKTALTLGLTFGLITLIRPTNGLIALFFILFNVINLKGFITRCKLFLNNYTHILLLVSIAILVWIPQLLYWNHISGEFFHYSYGDEGFFFDNPRIMRGLFGFRKGWLIYTPIMSLALIGLIIMAFLNKTRKAFFLPTIIFVPINIYIVLSWWCWWYGGSFGQRAFIDSYATLAIPLAFVIERGLSLNKRMKYIVLPILVFFVYLNCFQSWQFNTGMLHYSSMTKSAYLRIWGKVSKPHDLYCLLKRPDYKAAKFEGIDKSYYSKCPNQITLTSEEAGIPFKPKTAGIFRIKENSFISIHYGKKVFAQKLNIALDENDIYNVSFFLKRELVDKKLFYINIDEPGVHLYNYELSEKLKNDRFDEIKIFPIGGDKKYYFSHLSIE